MGDSGTISPEGAILEIFDAVGAEPLTASELADETDYAPGRIEAELAELIGRRTSGTPFWGRRAESTARRTATTAPVTPLRARRPQ